ncbi:MAG: hypothetical protein MK116_10060 [Phycisphaerales bacterium]|nr:hypothetical protein [Phycisphaerales bacterium]
MSTAAPSDFKALEELPDYTRSALIELAERGNVTITRVDAKVSPVGLDVLVDMTWTESSGSGKNRRTVTCYQTVMFFHRPESKLPKFRINHHEGFLSSWSAGATDNTGDAVVEIQDRPDFSKRYTISSPVPRSAGVLFTREMLDALDRGKGMEYRGNHNGIVAWRDKEQFKGEERRRMAEEAQAVFQAAMDDPETGARIAAAVPGSYAQEKVERWRTENTSTARKLLARIITRGEVDGLLSQAKPREAPRQIVRRVMGYNMVGIIVGAILTILGAIVATLMMSVADNNWLLLLYLIPALGLFILFLSIRQRRRRWWLLRRGQLVDARITATEDNGTSVNEEVMRKITFEPIGGAAEPFSVNLRSDASRVAHRIELSGESTPVLVNPDCPGIGIWLEGWVLENIPD